MKRIIHDKLRAWKDSRNRKPLILQGARQVGKSYILKKFGEKDFPVCHVFNFEHDKQRLSSTFEPDLDANRIINDLSIISGKKINPKNDLVIFDEIQECPDAMTSLKYFCEDKPELHLCCAGSLIGVKMSPKSFPVGKVNYLDMYPMTFEEFLHALNDELALESFYSCKKIHRQSKVAHNKLWEILKEYYVTGGMPEVIFSYIQKRKTRLDAMETARSVQQEIINSYFKDFAKHSGKTNSMHIVAVLENVPMQLSKYIDSSVKRYKFKGIIPGKKSFAEIQGPVEWLEKAGIIIKIKLCNKAEIPLESFCKNNIFKLFVFDIGILGCMLDLPVKSILAEDYGITKGYFAENFVAQEFLASGAFKQYSWTERNSEIEFLKVIDGSIVPIEVKSGQRTQAKSLRQYIKKYSPEKAIKITGKSLEVINDIVVNYPLYLAGII